MGNTARLGRGRRREKFGDMCMGVHDDVFSLAGKRKYIFLIQCTGTVL